MNLIQSTLSMLVYMKREGNFLNNKKDHHIAQHTDFFFQNREDNWSDLKNDFEVLLHREISEAISVYSIHIFIRSKGVDFAIFNLVNCQTHNLFKIFYNSCTGYLRC